MSSTCPTTWARTCRRTAQPSSTSSAWTTASRQPACSVSGTPCSPAHSRSTASKAITVSAPVTEDDYKHAVVQYGSHKAFNEFQAKDYIDKHGMDDHRGPPGQRHRSGQGSRLRRPREHNHPSGAGRADFLPLRGRDALPDPCRRHSRGVRPRADDRQAATRGLQFRRAGGFAGRNRRYRAWLPAGTRRSASTNRPEVATPPATG